MFFCKLPVIFPKNQKKPEKTKKNCNERGSLASNIMKREKVLMNNLPTLRHLAVKAQF